MASRHTSRITKISSPTAARYAENILSEEAVKKKYRFDDATWENLGTNETLIEKIEAEKIRRIRNGSCQTRASASCWSHKHPTFWGGNMLDASASPKHRIELSQSIRRVRSQRTGKSRRRRIGL